MSKDGERFQKIIAMPAHNFFYAVALVSSETTPLPIENITVADGIVRSESSNSCTIREGVLLSLPGSSVHANVVRAFSIQLLPTDDGYLATSFLSDICELELTRGNVVRKYLSSLLDELLWLRENEENLSDILMKELKRIEEYLVILQ